MHVYSEEAVDRASGGRGCPRSCRRGALLKLSQTYLQSNVGQPARCQPAERRRSRNRLELVRSGAEEELKDHHTTILQDVPYLKTCWTLYICAFNSYTSQHRLCTGRHRQRRQSQTCNPLIRHLRACATNRSSSAPYAGCWAISGLSKGWIRADARIYISDSCDHQPLITCF